MHEKDTAGEANPGVLTRPILVPIDATDVAEGILPYVSQLAKGADVPLLLHGVVDPDTIYYPAPKEFPDPSQRLRPGGLLANHHRNRAGPAVRPGGSCTQGPSRGYGVGPRRRHAHGYRWQVAWRGCKDGGQGNPGTPCDRDPPSRRAREVRPDRDVDARQKPYWAGYPRQRNRQGYSLVDAPGPSRYSRKGESVSGARRCGSDYGHGAARWFGNSPNLLCHT